MSLLYLSRLQISTYLGLRKENILPLFTFWCSISTCRLIQQDGSETYEICTGMNMGIKKVDDLYYDVVLAVDRSTSTVLSTGTIVFTWLGLVDNEGV